MILSSILILITSSIARSISSFVLSSILNSISSLITSSILRLNLRLKIRRVYSPRGLRGLRRTFHGSRIEHRLVERNLQGEDTVKVDHVEHCSTVRNLEDDNAVNVAYTEHCSVISKLTTNQQRSTSGLVTIRHSLKNPEM